MAFIAFEVNTDLSVFIVLGRAQYNIINGDDRAPIVHPTRPYNQNPSAPPSARVDTRMSLQTNQNSY